MAIVDLEYEEWQKNFEAEQPHLFTESNGLGPQTRAVAERRDLMRIAYSAGKAARGKQQGGEMQDSRALIHRYDTAGTHFRESLMDDYYYDTERVRRRKVLDAAHAELLAALAARQPVGDEERAELFRKGWEAGNAAHGIDLEQLRRLRNDLHVMSKHGVKDGWQDAAVELVGDVTRLIDSQRDAGAGVEE